MTHDPSNCGFCYDLCQGAATCTQGVCTAPNCDGAVVGGACAGNTGSADSSLTCVAGACVVSACSPGTGNESCAAGGAAGVGTCCGASCTPLGSDPANCSGCGQQCPVGATCNQGQCSSNCESAGCPSGLDCVLPLQGIGAVCVSPSCGGASRNETCGLDAGVSGACCAQGCMNVYADDHNCGTCGNVCGSGSACAGGVCQTTADCATAPMDSLCALGNGVGNCCGGSCQAINFQSDALNCNGCGQVCPTGSTCHQGGCFTADAGLAYCSNPGEACPTGDACSRQQAFCLTVSCGASQAQNPCVLTSGNEGFCCGAACADVNSDGQNCGQCGNACGSSQFCNQGQCVPTSACTPSNDGTACPVSPGVVGLCCQSTCVDPRSDAHNCVACGQICAYAGSCVGGVCQLVDGGYDECNGGVGCPSGTLCTGNGKCAITACPAAEVGLACAFGPGYQGGTCCSGSCVNLVLDPENCGVCGQACSSGVCTGTAQSPNGSLHQTECLPPNTSTSGTCGGTNGFGGGCGPTQTCVQDRCVTTSCSQAFPGSLCSPDGMSFGMCCGELGSSCVNPVTDPQNCGGCNVQCPAGQSCVQGACSGDTPACPAGSQVGYCNLDGGPGFLCCAGGGCTNVLADPQNCGFCGQACLSGQTCGNGQCLLVTCSASTQSQSCGLAGGSPGSCCGIGCVDINTDPSNCGGCGQHCASGQTCNGGRCGLDGCTVGAQGNPCHYDAGSGISPGACCGSACADIYTDPLNCGGCNLPCADAGCSGGFCQ